MSARGSRKFEFIDHTGDMGVRVFGQSLSALFQHAAEALFHIITDPKTIHEKESRRVSVQARGREELFISWLNEFVYLFDTHGYLFRRFEVLGLDQHLIEAMVYGETYEEGRHPIHRVIKGATYHQLRINQGKGGWEAQVIFDL
jgi:SHS2 domain-containing protein